MPSLDGSEAVLRRTRLWTGFHDAYGAAYTGGMSFGQFVQYHNAVPVALSIVLVGAGGAFAATNPEAIYSAQETVVAIDNTYLVGKDLSSYSPRTEITGVTEDGENYHVAYIFYTIDLQDYVWKDVAKNRVMTVSKELLGPYRDLGVYVTQQLRENIGSEQRRLAETQAIERTQVSQKIVATEYGGLVGRMLDTTTETLPGYVPVVTPPPPPPEESQVASASVPATPAPEAPAPGAPVIQILGNNPAAVAVGATYSDLGAVITGPTDVDRGLGIKIFVNGTEVAQPAIDTSVAGNWFIRYEATNAAGKRGTAERVVIVTDPNAAAAPPEETVSPSPSDTPATQEEVPQDDAQEEENEEIPPAAASSTPETQQEQISTTTEEETASTESDVGESAATSTTP